MCLHVFANKQHPTFLEGKEYIQYIKTELFLLSMLHNKANNIIYIGEFGLKQYTVYG